VIALGISTSTEQGSVALVDEGRVLASEAWIHLEGHAERLFAALDEVLARAGADRADLGIVGCDVGPGSFTGVRVGVASAQGVALGLGLRIVPVLSLEAIAFAASSAWPDVRAFAPAIDAKKDEAYLVEVLDGRRRGEPVHLARAEAIAWLEAARLRGTEPVGAFAQVLLGGPPPGELDALPHAVAVARLALARRDEAVPVARVAPEYVRAPDAKPQVQPGPR
jgi:tRNA threonylcarbamoyladenosine biosynthesis protein TsaB